MERSTGRFLLLSYMTFLGAHVLVGGESSCEQGSCYPATGDLLIGRESQLKASSTCGLERPQQFCVVSYLEKHPKCFICDSRQPWMPRVAENSHRVENIVSSFKRPRSRWWQAEAGQQEVSIQLDLETEFHFTHLIMTFKTFRPRVMLIERSFDFGKTWRVYRYFARNCNRSFPDVKKRVVERISDAICEQKYSSETPSTSGEVIFRVLPPSIPIPDPYNQEVQDLLKLTNLRINFTELHTLGDTLLDLGSEAMKKYYYALYDVTVRGSCSCYGHASRCLPMPGHNRSEESLRHMVHGMCECTHNTKGLNCEMCQDFHHDHPWSPARPQRPNVCKRCNCNNHASECHFDASRFQASGGVSGGVCDNCQHNTRGINCQECKPFYFQDPRRDIRDPGICQPCDCDNKGSQNKGNCQQTTDEASQTVAGRCICKPFVTGARCDSCQENHWNLQADNPGGCQPCNCSPRGSIPEFGCNQVTGACTCKRFVTGQNCDSCYPGFYDLSADNRHGCNPCDCDAGGAVKPSCDQRTGQCQCRSHIRGKQCTELDPGFFYASLDYYTFEAEHGRGIGNARVDIREPAAGSPSPWTGPGYMKVMEGDSIELSISGLPLSTYYDIVIRYENKMPEAFRDVRVTVIRPGHVRTYGPCGDSITRDYYKSVSLHPGGGYQVVSPPSCLEKGATYTLRLDFKSYILGQTHRAATLLVDSIVLAPNVNFMPMYQGPGRPGHLRGEFLEHRCAVIQLPVHKSSPLPEVCRKHTFSISAILHNGAIDCNCDHVGSVSVECSPNGGQCDCRPNVAGRRCDHCAAGSYGFSPRGCLACNCHEIGARDNFCNHQTGKCTCIEHVTGRTCDLCRPGFWGFPQCRPCQCNGNADQCDSLTGVCLGCRAFTEGSFCDRCQPGYHGDPRQGANMPCRPCMCPDGPTSSVQHADTCSFSHVTREVNCNCRAGYTGRHCETCIDNYYGVPTLLGGQCRPCTCNNNINPDDPGSCDGRTGECLKCLFNSQGHACGRCRSGYYGDATKQGCVACVCYHLGTRGTREECDHLSGQCPCHPNVIGKQCDRCAPGHWNLASRRGCTHCKCDGAGSVSLECNQLTGLCECLPGRGGPTCAECENFFYGDPYYQCFPCDCNVQGSKSGQCDRRTGQCACLDGVTGHKCDRCARGTTGDLPNCVPCGECFDSWEKVIMRLRESTHNFVRKASDLSVSGAVRAFNEGQMRKTLSQASALSSSHRHISEVSNMLAALKIKLTDNSRVLNEVEDELRTKKSRVRRDSIRVHMLKARVDNLKTSAMQLQINVTNVQFQEVGGASGKILEAADRSRKAQRVMEDSSKVLAQSERFREETGSLVSARQNVFDDQLRNNAGALDRLESEIKKMGGNLSDINNLMCGQPAAPCSVLCGGAGCGRCGGVGCGGALTISQSALTTAQKTQQLLDSKNINAKQFISRIQEAKQEAVDAKSHAQLAFSDATMARNHSEATRVDLEAAVRRVGHFLVGSNSTSPDSVAQAARDVLALEIPLEAAHIHQLAVKIRGVVTSLTGIEEVLNQTAQNRETAGQLQQQAQQVLSDARTAHDDAHEVRTALAAASTCQARAGQVLETTRNVILSAEEDFDMIIDNNHEVQNNTMATRESLDKLKTSLDQVTRRYAALEMDTLDKAQKTAEEAHSLAVEAARKAKDLDVISGGPVPKLTAQPNHTVTAKTLAGQLKARADKISMFTETKLIALREIQENLQRNENRLTKLQDQIDTLNNRMTGYLLEIRNRYKDYETC